MEDERPVQPKRSNKTKAVTWQQVVMYLVGFVLIYLAIRKEYEPSLLLPMGF